MDIRWYVIVTNKDLGLGNAKEKQNLKHSVLLMALQMNLRGKKLEKGKLVVKLLELSRGCRNKELTGRQW